MSLIRTGYSCFSWLGAPLVTGYLKWRAYKGLEDKSRLHERMGRTSVSRPEKTLLWINAVSVGEAVAAITITQAILKKIPRSPCIIDNNNSFVCEGYREKAS